MIEGNSRAMATLMHTDHPQQSGPEAALMSPNALYRSKVLKVNHGINPMLSASAPLFSIISMCQHLPANAQLSKLQQALEHEIYAFECTIQSQCDYPENMILAARYALCTFVDETIERALADHADLWQPFSLLYRFHGTHQGGHQFYTLLERASATPEKAIDLLELFYLCLSLGYQGKFCDSSQGFLIRENIVNRLYQSIHEQRGEVTRSVMVGNEHAAPTVTPKRTSHKGILAICMMAILSVSGIVLSEFYSVQDSNQSVQQSMTHLLHAGLANPSALTMSQPR